MKTLKLILSEFVIPIRKLENLFLFILLTLSWFTLPKLLRLIEPTAALIDAGIWQLLLFGLICFATILAGTWWVVYRFWQQLGLIEFKIMVSQFNHLSLWQQLGFFWASFALLLLAAIACLAAVI